MATVNLTISGGDKMTKVLAGISSRITKGRQLRVGFLEGATYPVGDSEEFIKKMQAIRLEKRVAKAANRQTLAGKNAANISPLVRASGVRRARMADFGLTTTLHVAQVAFWNEFGTKIAPPRPFFRQTIAAKSPEWGDNLAGLVKANGYDGMKILKLMGKLIEGQIVTSIAQWPADNAPLTVQLKGFNKGLVDSGQMMRSVDYEVSAKS